MTVRVVVLDDWEGAARSADWESLGAGVSVTVQTEHLVGEPSVANALAGAEVAVAMRERTPITETLLAALPDLRLIVTTGAANAAIDLDECRRRGIIVCGTGSHPGGPAELTWALILAAARRLDRVLPGMRAGEWPSLPGTALHGRTIGLIGLGRVGSQVARVGAAFGMEVRAWTPTLTPERAAENDAIAASFDEVVERADFLSLHAPLNDRTRGIVGRPVLERMKASAWLINASRSGLVDRLALTEALDGGGLAGAALDVFDAEPLEAGDPLRARSNVILTPHLGYVTDLGLEHWFRDVVADIAAWRSGDPIRVIV
ncbi:D-2-hydroxyacid dehydrogenase family protein [Microbacterium pseudoresistens]